MDLFFKPRETKILCGKRLEVAKKSEEIPKQDSKQRQILKFANTSNIPYLEVTQASEFQYVPLDTPFAEAKSSTCHSLKNLPTIAEIEILDEENLLKLGQELLALHGQSQRTEQKQTETNSANVNNLQVKECPRPPRLQVKFPKTGVITEVWDVQVEFRNRHFPILQRITSSNPDTSLLHVVRVQVYQSLESCSSCTSNNPKPVQATKSFTQSSLKFLPVINSTDIILDSFTCSNASKLDSKCSRKSEQRSLEVGIKLIDILICILKIKYFG